MRGKNIKNKSKIGGIIIALAIAIIVIIVAALLFSKDEESQKYSVTFETHGGSAVEVIMVEDNKTFAKPEDPTKEGYSFLGWYYNNELYDFSKPVTSNIKLEAKWVEIEEGNQTEEPKEDLDVKVTGVTLNKTTLTLTEGESEKLTAKVKPSNATNKDVTWSSNKKTVVTVDSKGNVKAVKAGTATITVTTKDGKYTETCKVTVKAKTTPENPTVTDVKVTGVTLNKTTLSLTEGDSSKLTATVAPSNATNKNVTWKSSNTSVATVDASGNVKAVKAGTATITVTTKDGSHTATCTVTVKEKPASYVITITPEAQDVGGVLRYKLSVTKNNSPFTGYQRIICNGMRLGSTVSLSQYEKITTSATIILADGTEVTATVKK